MKYIITGGAGFIGSHLVDYLKDRHDLVVIDDFSTGKRENIATFQEHPHVRFVQKSIVNRASLTPLFTGVDGVFHQAAIPSVPRSVQDPFPTHEAGLTGTLNVLLAARDSGVNKVVCASSSSVYGDTLVLPKREDMTPHPKSPYAVTKVAGEYYCQVFADLYGMQTVSLRYFNVYGPRQDPLSPYAAVIPKFISRLLNREPPLIYGDGTQTRDFTYIKDILQANRKAMESRARGVYNVGCGRQTSIRDLASLLAELLDIDIEPSYLPARPGDVAHSRADISAAEQGFNYKPEYRIEQGLKETISWYTGH